MPTSVLPFHTSSPSDNLQDADSPMVLLSVRALQRRWEELAMEPAGPQRLWQEGFRQGSWIAGIFIGQQPAPGAEELQRLGVMVLEGLGLCGLRIAEAPADQAVGSPAKRGAGGCAGRAGGRRSGCGGAGSRAAG